MKVQVRLFAVLREVAGAAQVEQELSPQATVQDLMDALATRYPALLLPMASVRAAVNRQYVPLQATLHDGDEVALVPPVGGG